jgi:hypothetical protein
MATQQGAANHGAGEAPMNEGTQGTGQTSPVMTAHDMIEASARLGSYPPPVPPTRRAGRGPRFGHQLQYDESGFPIPEDRAGFTERVRQLLRG